MKKIISLLISAALIASIFTGCGRTAQKTNDLTTPQNTNGNEKIAPPANEAVDDKKDENKIILEGEGNFSGIVDSNSVEIETKIPNSNEPFTVFRLDSGIRDSFTSKQLETGEKVKFTYYLVEGEQPVLTSIERVNPAE